MSDVDDGELLERWRLGDADAGELLVRRHMSVLYRFVRTKLDRDVDELIQRVWLSVLEARTPFRRASSFVTFLLGFARITLLEHFRDQRRDAIVDWGSISVADLGVTPSQWVLADQQQRQLLHALRRLSFDQQVAIELFYFEQLAGSEIAEILGESPHTVRSRLSRARADLRTMVDAMERRGAAPESTASDLESWARSLRAAIESG